MKLLASATLSFLFFSNITTQAATVENNPYVYLDTEKPEFKDENKTKLLSTTAGKLTPTGEEVSAWVEGYTKGKVYKKIAQLYTKDLFKVLGVPKLNYTNSRDSERWRKKNKKLIDGVDKYTGGDDSGGGFSDKLNWSIINKKLNKEEALSIDEEKFYQDILFSIYTLPKINGLVFRGTKGTQESFNKLKIGDPLTRFGFTSTSLSFEVALGFAYYGQENPQVVIVLDSLAGAPMSALTFGDLPEFEALLLPKVDIKVTYKIQDFEKNIAYIFATQGK